MLGSDAAVRDGAIGAGGDRLNADQGKCLARRLQKWLASGRRWRRELESEDRDQDPELE